MISLPVSVIHNIAAESMSSPKYLTELIDKQILDSARRGKYTTCFSLTESEYNAGMGQRMGQILY